MKLTKKLLLAAAVMMAASFGFMGCGEDDDDPYNMITKVNSDKYTIAHENTDSYVHRGYNSAGQEHRGAVVKFTFDDPTKDSGVLGFTWDLHVEDTTTNKRTFFLFGLQLNKNSTGTSTKNIPTLHYYISKYYHVESIQAYNFGAADQTTHDTSGYTVSSNETGVAATTPVEYEFKTPTVLTTSDFKTADDKYIIWADIYPINSADEANGHTVGNVGTVSKLTGAFGIQLYKAKEDGTIDTDSPVGDLITISTDLTGYTTTKPDDATIGVYANAYAYSTINGSWEYNDVYTQAEVIEDAE